MQNNKLYHQNISTIVKFITFYNEFDSLADIECKPGSKEKRTSVYFGRPYHLYDCASIENRNGRICYFIKKRHRYKYCG